MHFRCTKAVNWGDGRRLEAGDARVRAVGIAVCVAKKKAWTGCRKNDKKTPKK